MLELKIPVVILGTREKLWNVTMINGSFRSLQEGLEWNTVVAQIRGASTIVGDGWKQSVALHWPMS